MGDWLLASHFLMDRHPREARDCSTEPVCWEAVSDDHRILPASVTERGALSSYGFRTRD
jgi:hypothetical protein